MIPAAFAEDWIDFVLAVRQPLSEPTWEKPSVIPAVLRCVAAGFPAAVPASAAASTRATLVEVIANHFFDTLNLLRFGVNAELMIVACGARC